MKLEMITRDDVFETFDTSIVRIDINDNIIRIATINKIPFGGYVVNCLRDTFNEHSYECDFAKTTNSVIYIKAIDEDLIATIRPIVDSTVVAIGFVSTYYDVAAENIEED